MLQRGTSAAGLALWRSSEEASLAGAGVQDKEMVGDEDREMMGRPDCEGLSGSFAITFLFSTNWKDTEIHME